MNDLFGHCVNLCSYTVKKPNLRSLYIILVPTALGVEWTSGFDSSHLEERVYLRRSSFRPAASTFICVLGWDRDASRFADSCLLIPSLDIAGLTRVESEWMVLELEPGSAFHRRLHQYRTSLASLGATVVAMV